MTFFKPIYPKSIHRSALLVRELCKKTGAVLPFSSHCELESGESLMLWFVHFVMLSSLFFHCLPLFQPPGTSTCTMVLVSSFDLLLLLLQFIRWKFQSPWWRWQCIVGPSGFHRACGLRECGLVRFPFWVAHRWGRTAVDVLLSDCQYRKVTALYSQCGVWNTRDSWRGCGLSWAWRLSLGPVWLTSSRGQFIWSQDMPYSCLWKPWVKKSLKLRFVHSLMFSHLLLCLPLCQPLDLQDGFLQVCLIWWHSITTSVFDFLVMVRRLSWGILSSPLCASGST